MDKKYISELISLRQKLHSNPELSHKEEETSKTISEYFTELKPDKVLNDLGGHGLAFIFDSGKPGETILFRSDMDGLPINETTDLTWKSKNQGVSHKCGHDGHIAIMCGLGKMISKTRPLKGKVVLLFQPAEETGEGAELVIKDLINKGVKPDYSFGMHNLPGYKENSVIIKTGDFASASKGLIIKLEGITSHAAEPEKGISPSMAVAKLIPLLESLTRNKKMFRNKVLATIIHVKIGEVAFGTSPASAVIMVTLRAYNNADLKIMGNLSEGFVKITANKYKLDYSIEFTEIFPATINNSECVRMVQKASKNLNLEIIKPAFPFKWSEDFGHFSSISPSAFFGIGAGENHPALHHPDYDFPDEIIETGAKTFFEIYKQTLL